MNRSIWLAVGALLITSPALAANGANLSVAITPPAGVQVYQSGRYNVAVSNTGNRSAANVSLRIQLPLTHTSPTVHVMGTLGAMDPRCSPSGTALVCSLGSMARNTSKTVYFDIALPYSTAPLTFDASVTTTTQESDPSNNSAQHVATPLTYAVAMSPPHTVINDHCTGQGLTSYFECTLFPSSISSHTVVFNSDGTITIPNEPTFSGTWTQVAPDRLQFQYLENSVVVAQFDGRGVSPTCFEGPTTFPGSPYVAMYHVCLQ